MALCVSRVMAGNPFTEHPREVGEGYFGHMRAALGVGVIMAGGALACLVHAFLPFLFVRTGSETITKLHRKVHKRVEGPNWERHPII